MLFLVLKAQLRLDFELPGTALNHLLYCLINQITIFYLVSVLANNQQTEANNKQNENVLFATTGRITKNRSRR